MQIRPISDLRNKFTEIERTINEGNPVYLTKNGYGAAVVLSLAEYSRLINPVERALDEADYFANHYSARMSHDEVFGKLREKVDAK